MAKVQQTFQMAQAPGRAQELFVEDVAPALHKLGGFVLYKQQPGRLAFSDGMVSDPLAYEIDYSLGRRLLARRLKVDFLSEAAGSRVSISGHATRDVRDAIKLLGRPGHWPAARV